MTHFVDFVALGWVEHNLRGEVEAARRSIHCFQREPDDPSHLQDAGRYIHSATGALRLCALEPAAMLAEEVETVLGQLHEKALNGATSKEVMTELVAAIEALPAYLANVRSKREVTPASMAKVVNDLRRATGRPALPESLFFDPPLRAGAGISTGMPAPDDAALRKYANEALAVWDKHAGIALKGTRAGVMQLLSVADRASQELAGTVLEPYCTAFACLLELMADQGLVADEAIVKLFHDSRKSLQYLEERGTGALQFNAREQHLKHMLYYIGKAQQRTSRGRALLDAFGIDNVEEYLQVAEGRMIQEDDLLDALGQTLTQLMEIMGFLAARDARICADNIELVEKVVPSLLQVSMQLHVVGLPELASNVNLQYKTLAAFAQREKPTPAAELVDFGGALSAIRDEIEFKLKHGLSAVGNAATLDLDGAVTDQVTHCLQEMKNIIHRDLARQDLDALVQGGVEQLDLSVSGLRPIFRAARLVAEPELRMAIDEWDHENLPDAETAMAIAQGLLGKLADENLLNSAAAHLEEVVSVLGMMENRDKERDVLRKCSGFLNGSIALGGIEQDQSLNCFTETIAALEQFLECRRADPWSAQEHHLARADKMAVKLATFISQRNNRANPDANVVEFGDSGKKRSAPEPQVDTGAGVAEQAGSAEIHAVETGSEGGEAPAAAEAGQAPAAAVASGPMPWREAMGAWNAYAVNRPAEPIPDDAEHEIDRELLECFVEEMGEYLNTLADACGRFSANPTDANIIKEIRTVFHTLKGSARTINLAAFGEFMYDMEKVFNALRDSYIEGTPEIAEFVSTVAPRLPYFNELIGKSIPLEEADFSVPSAIASAISGKEFSDDMTVEVSLPAAAPAAEPAAAEAAPEEAAEAVEDIVIELPEEVPAYAPELWQTHSAQQLLDAIRGALETYEPAPAKEELEQAAMLAGAVVPGIVELRDNALVELQEDSIGLFFSLPGIEHLASGAVYGLHENDDGEQVKLSLSPNAQHALEDYLVSLRDNPALEHLHNCGVRLLHAALGLPEPEISEPAPAEQSAAEQAAAVDDQDAELMGVFIEDLEANTEALDAATSALAGGDQGALREIKNILHTVKGSANTIGLYRLGGLVHDLESRIMDLEVAKDIAPAEITERVDSLAAEFHDAAQFVSQNRADYSPAAEGAPAAERAPEEEAYAEVVEQEAPAEDIDTELMGIFLEDLEANTESLDAATAALAGGDQNALREIKNILHTVKGSANTIGLRRFGGLVHDYESRIMDLEVAKGIDPAEVAANVDAIAADFHDTAKVVRQNRGDYSDEAAPEQAEAPAAPAEDLVMPEAAGLDSAPNVELANVDRLASLRVETHKVDQLLDMGLEVSMSSVRCRQELDLAAADRGELQDLARRIANLVDQLSLQLDTEIQSKTETLSEGEHFDPLEMDRMTEKQNLAAILREAAFDLEEESRSLGYHLGNAIREVQGSSRLSQASQGELRQMRLINFSRLGPGFRRLVSQTSRKLGKEVDFEFTCGDGGLDVKVFEQLRTALEHMLRNSVDHGIDMPEDRAAQGKARNGKVQLAIARRGTEFVIRLLDDGKGMDPEVLRGKARDKGLLKEGEEISDEEALRLIFRPGFSTATEITDVSGRGVGMDVVLQSISQAGGTVEVSSKKGFFTQFEIRIPANIMVNEALLATVGEEQIAIPLTSLKGSEFHHREKVHEAITATDGRLSFRGQDYEVRYLGAVRGTLPAPELELMPDFVPVLYAQLGRRYVAFFADALDTSEDLVIRSLGAQFTKVPGVAGGAVKSDGKPVLALDLNEFIAQVEHADAHGDDIGASKDEGLFVFCVDDSVMMRRTYEKRLGSLGYTVATAVDGEDALDFLSQSPRVPDFIFTDLEMPKMNGFDFIANLRRVPEFEHIPTVVVSSRDGDKHRAEAQRVGASGFMAKGANSAEGMQAMIDRFLHQKSRAKVS